MGMTFLRAIFYYIAIGLIMMFDEVTYTTLERGDDFGWLLAVVEGMAVTAVIFKIYYDGFNKALSVHQTKQEDKQ